MTIWTKEDQWRTNWRGEGHEDWDGFDGDIRIGRVMRDLTTHNRKGWYLWSGGASGRDGFRKRLMPYQGWKREHWEAAKR